MNSELVGVVNLDRLPAEEIYVELGKSFVKKLNEEIRLIWVSKFAGKLTVSSRKIIHWLNGETLIRLDILKKICSYFNFEFQQRIVYMRGKKGNGIINPKLPFDFTSIEGTRVVAAILGDGGIPKRKTNPYYTNSSSRLIQGFIQDLHFVLGEVEKSLYIKKRKNGPITVLELPTVVCHALIALGLQPGKKVETNQGIPGFIMRLQNEKKLAFISQYLDDEGNVNIKAKHMRFTNACLIKTVLSGFGIETSMYAERDYKSSRGEMRTIWRLQVNGQDQLRYLHQNLIIRHKKKKERLVRLLTSYKLRVFRKKEVVPRYIHAMETIEAERGCFTTFDLAKETGMKLGSCRNTILKFRRLNLIKCIHSFTSGNSHERGEYVLVKNGTYR